jgi:hypothetical protein
LLPPLGGFPEELEMRTGSPLLAIWIGVFASAAQAWPDETPAKRFGIEADLKSYPQATPKETLGSLLKAVGNKRVDYVLAQLADPEWVDGRVKQTGGGFAALVEESTARLVDDPAAVKRLEKLHASGEWKIETDAASVRLKDSDIPALFYRKVNGRWYVENRKK